MKFSESEYKQRIGKLFSRFQSVQKVGFTGSAYKPGLAGMERLDARLGHPWKRYPCIHVAGTNGKGSVASMIAAGLGAAVTGTSGAATGPGETAPLSGALPRNARIGLYTSPHLLDFRERMKVIEGDAFSMIPPEEVWEFLESYEADFEGLSFFEITTGMAFWWFARKGVDAAVIEAGLGGRLDSTNIITPAISVITSIGLDHCALLGDTRAAIAAEKAGIFKPGVPAVAGTRDAETAPVFEKAAACTGRSSADGTTGCPLIFADEVPAAPQEAELLRGMDLQGPCQAENLHTALTVLDTLAACGLPGNLQPARQALEEALRNTARITGLHGRWEKVLEAPETICDIGHNPPALMQNFARVGEICRTRPTTIVYGVMADKDLAGIAPLMPEGAEYIFAAPDTMRALPEEELLSRIRELRPELVCRTAPCVASAVGTAIGKASAQDNPFIYIGGSTFVVAEAVEYLNKYRHETDYLSSTGTQHYAPLTINGTD